MGTLHMRIDGQSRDFNLDTLRLTPTSTDAEVREAVANFLDKPVGFMSAFAVDRAGNNITVRPNAVFGLR